MQTLATWKQPRKKAAKRQKIFTIELAVLTCLCGIVAGYGLGYKHSKVHQLTYELGGCPRKPQLSNQELLVVP